MGLEIGKELYLITFLTTIFFTMIIFMKHKQNSSFKKKLLIPCFILLLTSINAQKTYPPDLWYTKDHMWLRINKDKTITMGVTDFMQKNIGRVVFFIEQGNIGTILEEGEALCEIESLTDRRIIHIPLTGKIVSFNKELITFPEEINESPYNEGWIVVISPSDDFKFNGLFLNSSRYLEMLLR